MDSIRTLAERHGISVVEDAAEAHGAEYLVRRDGPSPTWRRCGGMSGSGHFQLLRQQAAHDRRGWHGDHRRRHVCRAGTQFPQPLLPAEQRFLHTQLGHNFRMTKPAGALGVAQARAVRSDRGPQALDGPGLHRAPAGDPRPAASRGARLGPQRLLDVRLVLDVRPRHGRADVCRSSPRRGCGHRPFFLGMHEQPALRDRGLFLEEPPPGDRADRPPGPVPAVRAGAHRGAARPRGRGGAAGAGVSDDPVFGTDYAGAYDTLYEDKDYAAEVAAVEAAFGRTRLGRSAVCSTWAAGRAATCSHSVRAATRWRAWTARRQCWPGHVKKLDQLCGARAGGHSIGATCATRGSGEDVRRGAADVRRAGLSAQQRGRAGRSGYGESALEPGGLLMFDVWYGPAVMATRPSDRVKVIPTPDGQIIRLAAGLARLASPCLHGLLSALADRGRAAGERDDRGAPHAVLLSAGIGAVLAIVASGWPS